MSQLARPYDWSTKLIVGLHPRAVFHLRLQAAQHETTPPRGRGQPQGTRQSKTHTLSKRPRDTEPPMIGAIGGRAPRGAPGVVRQRGKTPTKRNGAARLV